jgi:uncharacterized damage-inducible protein DinB
MIANQIRKLFAFNSWAWERVFASVEKLNEDDYHAPRHLFEGSIHATLVHCLSAESIWYARCEGASPDSLFDPQDFSDCFAVREYWRPVTDNWASYVQALSDEQCARLIEYRNTRGNGFSLQLVDILQHVMNHATEHRSQLTPILYHLELPTKPLDYMRFQLRP